MTSDTKTSSILEPLNAVLWSLSIKRNCVLHDLPGNEGICMHPLNMMEKRPCCFENCPPHILGGDDK